MGIYENVNNVESSFFLSSPKIICTCNKKYKLALDVYFAKITYKLVLIMGSRIKSGLTAGRLDKLKYIKRENGVEPVDEALLDSIAKKTG